MTVLIRDGNDSYCFSKNVLASAICSRISSGNNRDQWRHLELIEPRLIPVTRSGQWHCSWSRQELTLRPEVGWPRVVSLSKFHRWSWQTLGFLSSEPSPTWFCSKGSLANRLTPSSVSRVIPSTFKFSNCHHSNTSGISVDLAFSFSSSWIYIPQNQLLVVLTQFSLTSNRASSLWLYWVIFGMNSSKTLWGHILWTVKLMKNYT